MTVPQHGHSRPGSAHSVAFRMTSTSMTCAHREPAACAPSSAGPALAALRRRLRVLVLIRVRIPLQALALMPGLPASLAVPAPLPLRLLPRPPRLLRPDPLLRAGRPRIRAVHRQAPFQLRQPQLQPPPQLPLGIQLPPQHRVLRVLRLHHSPQPRQQLTLPRDLPGRARLLRHEPQACSTCTKGSNTRQHRRVAQNPVNGHEARHGLSGRLPKPESAGARPVDPHTPRIRRLIKSLASLHPGELLPTAHRAASLVIGPGPGRYG